MKYCFLFLLFFFSWSNYTQQDSLTYYNQQINSNFNLNKETNALFQKKLNYLKNNNNLEEYLYAHFDYFMLNANAEEITILTKAEKNKWRKTKTNNEKIAQLHLKINIGYHHLKFGHISKSILAYENALHFYKKTNIKNYDIVEYCLKPLANNYTRIGDYSRADDIFKYTLQLAEQNKNKSHLIATYLNLSIQYQSINKNNEAISILEKALQIKPISNLQKSTLLSEIGKNYYKLNQLKKAIDYINKSNKLIKSNATHQKNYLTKGMCLKMQGHFKKAEKSFKKALNIAKLEYGNNNREVGKIYNLLATIFFEKNENEKALDFYQKGLQAVLKNYNPSTIYENPKSNTFYAENTIKESLDGRAIIFTKLNNYKNAIENYTLAFEIEKLLQKTYTSQESKIRQQTENRERSEKLVTIYLQQYKKSNNKKHLELAFNSVEKSKANVLSNTLNTKFLKSSLQNDSLFQKEKKLIEEKAILTKKINLEELKNKQADLDKLKLYISQKTKITTTLQVLKHQLFKKYPFLNNSAQIVPVREIKENLLFKNQKLIEFFDTRNNLYIFTIDKNKPISFRKVVKDSLYNKSLQEFISYFTDGNSNKLKNDISAYQKNAYYLYTKLLQPELANSKTKLLTIIPDGKLNFLAFDALLTNKTESINFGKLPYLLFQNSINYAYSSTILMQQKSQFKSLSKQNKLIGFFPVFENNYRDLQELTYTLNEENDIKKYTKGEYFSTKQATKNMFLQKANEFDIIHLSTHASAGNFFEPAHIEFRDNTLYLPEIYGLNLSTNLLVMSACETGIGKLQKGEGAMSLARGFSYTGVKNLLVSLWKVNDKATSILMRNFYKNYKKSTNKSESLHQAKLDYLSDKSISNIKKSPYYWSSFVFIGNVEPNTSSNFNIYVFLSLILISLVILYFLKIKKKDMK
jgi:CHAT domain-containing protein